MGVVINSNKTNYYCVVNGGKKTITNLNLRQSPRNLKICAFIC